MEPRVAVLWLLLAAFALRAFRLDMPPIPIFDEGLFYIPAAEAYLAGLADPNFEHPPLGKLCIAAGLALFGDGPWGWRFPSVVAGVLGIALAHRLGRRLWGSSRMGLAGAALLSLDFLWFEFSRLALLDVFQAALLLLGLNLLPLPGGPPGLRGPRTETLRWLPAGLALGLAAAVKWSAAWVLPAVLLVLIGLRVRRAPALVVLGAGLVAGYSLSWLYHGLVLGYGVPDILGLHVRMITYQTQVGAATAAAPDLVLAPAWWLLNGPLVVTAREDRGVWMLVMSNPFVFWVGLAAAAVLTVRAFREPHGPEGVLSLAILGLYLPWFGVVRVKYFYYLLPVLPLLCVAIPGAWERCGAILGERRRFVGALFLAASAAAFAGAYPALTASWPR